jgi:hypothetical protein
MSGPICPDCGHPGLSGSPAASTCELCGWTGDTRDLGRKIMPPEAYDEAEERARAKREGRLFFVTFEAGEDGDAVFGVMESLGATGCSGAGRRHRIELTARPSDEAIEAARKVKGVRNLKLV